MENWAQQLVVPENAYDMLKGRQCLIYKKYKSKMHNFKYVVTACYITYVLRDKTLATQDGNYMLISLVQLKKYLLYRKQRPITRDQQ